MSEEIVEKKLYKCKKCGRLVPPIRLPNILILFSSVIPFIWFPYLIYFIFFKQAECVYCGNLFSKEEMK